MKTLLLATHNPAKLHELRQGAQLLVEKGVNILSVNDLNLTQKPEENGKTFQANALLKAKYYSDLTGYPAIADDGGLTIDILNNEPGVKSRRWLGYEAGDDELITYTLERLQGIPLSKRTAYLQTCLCFYHSPFSAQAYSNASPQPTIIYETAKIKGYIAKKSASHWQQGYPYRALFVVEQFKKYYDELTESEHRQVNHRLRAMMRLAEKIEKYLLQ